MKRSITILFVLMISISAYSYTTNWFAEEHFSLGKKYYENGQHNKAIKEFQKAIEAYETYVSTERSPERGKIYYYMALTYFNMLENFAINNPNYKLITIKAKSVLDKSIQIQWENPIVNDYYSSNPNLLFKFDELSFVPEVREYQEMKNLLKMFKKREKSDMFTFSRNINMKHNLLEVGFTYYKNPPSTTSEKTAKPKVQAEPSGSGGKKEENITQEAEESKKKAQEVEQRTEEILPTVY